MFNKITYTSLLFLLLVVVSSHTFSQMPVATAKLDTQEILIGDQLNLRLSFSGLSGAMVAWPILPDTLTSKVDVLDRGLIDTLKNRAGQDSAYIQNILLTSFDSGFYEIPSIQFPFMVADDTNLYAVQTRPTYLMVHTVAVDTTKPIKPIKGIMSAPLTFRDILPWLLIGLLALLIITFVIYYIIKRKRKEPVFQLRPRIKLKPHEIALRALEQLRTKKLWQQGAVKQYYTELTDVIREYLEARFNIPAMERTTFEILRDLKDTSKADEGSMELLKKVLELADMVKFAKWKPGPDENNASLEEGIRFVEQTRLIEDPGSDDPNRPSRIAHPTSKES
jgi:hypothetical protein